MKHRRLIGAGALTFAIAFVWAANSPVAGEVSPKRPQAAKAEQAPAAAKAATAKKAYVAPRTPDGQPDIQGFWTNSTYTPLERPNNVTKEFYTPEEFEAVIKQAATREEEQTTPGTVADVHYDFTQFGLDRSQAAFAKNLRTSLITNPENGRLPPVTPEGQKRAQARAAAQKALGAPRDSVETLPIGTRCIIMAGAGPPMMNAGYNANYQIVQGTGYVMILTEMIHDVRIIPIDNRPHPDQKIRQWMGNSTGHWDGDTLIVETTNFNGKNPFRGSSENMKVTERFTRTSKDQVVYNFTVEDSDTWARSWTAEMPMQKTEGPIFEHACHEGNYGLMNTLSGARLEEKRAAEAAAKKNQK